MPEQLPDDDVIAEGWEKAAVALEPARDAWLAISPDSAGPLTEMLHCARWNATVWRQRSRGVERADAWRAADAEHGRPDYRHINYEVLEESDGGDVA